MKTADGVYFRHEDYASFWRRVLIDVIDALVVGAICSVLAIALLVTFPLNRTTFQLISATFAVTAFCYLVVLKRSKIGTIGYRIGAVRIVGLNGQTPSLSAVTLRLLFAPLGPLNWVLDLAWLSGNKHRQSLRDKLAHTYVVKVKAQPVGTGKIIYRYYEICRYNFLFREIDVPTATTTPGLPGSAGQS